MVLEGMLRVPKWQIKIINNSINTTLCTTIIRYVFESWLKKFEIERLICKP
jgi:hypothetical protein